MSRLGTATSLAIMICQVLRFWALVDASSGLLIPLPLILVCSVQVSFGLSLGLLCFTPVNQGL